MIDAVDGDREESLRAVRSAMILSRRFRAAVLIGGMEGLDQEEAMISDLQPDCEVLPIASTGAAATDVFRGGHYPAELQSELTYTSLISRHFAVPN